MFHPDGPSFLELARQALSSTERGYDLLAPKFDYTPFRTPEPIVRAALSHLGRVDTAIDLCCGTGAVLHSMRTICRRRVVGVDFSAGMLGECRRRLVHAPGAAAVDLVRADIRRLPFRSVFDVATCFGALGHIPEDEGPQLLESVARCLAPGGRFVFLSADKPPRWSLRYGLALGFDSAMRLRNALRTPAFVMYYLAFLLPEVRDQLQRAGFRVEVLSDVFPPPYSRARLVIASPRLYSAR